MGLLDRWVKKKTAEQLNRENDHSVVVDSKKSENDTVAKSGENTVVKKKKATKIIPESKDSKKVVSTKKKTAAKTSNESSSKDLKIANSRVYETLLHPLVTEKSSLLQTFNQYVFRIGTAATKRDVKLAVKSMYGISPVSVKMINVNGKMTRFGSQRGRRSDFKKAIVTLPKGSDIKISETV